MYVDPFMAGVLTTLLFEMTALILFAIFHRRK